MWQRHCEDFEEEKIHQGVSGCVKFLVNASLSLRERGAYNLLSTRAKSYDRTIRRATQRERYDQMVRELSRAIKDFSRRQMTWFKRDKRIVWMDTGKEAARLVRKFIL